MLSMLFLLCTYFSIIIVALPRSQSPLSPRQINPNALPINATITDHAGQDITSSFKIMLFQQPQPVAVKNLTSRRIWTSQGLSRPMNHCQGHDSEGGQLEFIRSSCKPQANTVSSLQAYQIVCHRIVPSHDAYTGEPDGTREEPSFRSGHCRQDEICVDGLGPRKSASGSQVATCVAIEYFDWILGGRPTGPGNKTAEKETTELAGRKATLVVSEVDGSTPLEVDTLSVQAAPAIRDHLGADGEGVVATQSMQCRDCVEFQTGLLAEGTEGLKAQVRLLTTGAAVGILWLAVASG